MLKNYLKVGWRNLMKNKTFSFINIFGLAIGFTCCLLISLYIYNELSYDTYHKDGDRIYQLGSASVLNGKEERRGNTSAPLAKAMQQEYPEHAVTLQIPLFLKSSPTTSRKGIQPLLWRSRTRLYFLTKSRKNCLAGGPH
jgi:hypothetical protein